MSEHHLAEPHSPLDDVCFLDALERVLERGVRIDAHIGVDVVGLRLVDVHCRIRVYVERPDPGRRFGPGTYGSGFLRGAVVGPGPALPDHLRN